MVLMLSRLKFIWVGPLVVLMNPSLAKIYEQEFVISFLISSNLRNNKRACCFQQTLFNRVTMKNKRGFSFVILFDLTSLQKQRSKQRSNPLTIITFRHVYTLNFYKNCLAPGVQFPWDVLHQSKAKTMLAFIPILPTIPVNNTKISS